MPCSLFIILSPIRFLVIKGINFTSLYSLSCILPLWQVGIQFWLFCELFNIMHKSDSELAMTLFFFSFFWSCGKTLVNIVMTSNGVTVYVYDAFFRHFIAKSSAGLLDLQFNILFSGENCYTCHSTLVLFPLLLSIIFPLSG